MVSIDSSTYTIEIATEWIEMKPGKGVDARHGWRKSQTVNFVVSFSQIIFKCFFINK